MTFPYILSSALPYIVDQNFALQWVQEHVRSMSVHMTRSTDECGRSRRSAAIPLRSRYGASLRVRFISSYHWRDTEAWIGAGSVIQHIIAHGGQTEPPLFRAAMTSSTFLPFQYYYNDTIPEVKFLVHYIPFSDSLL